MKKLLSLFAALILVSTFAAAQTSVTEGLKVGVNLDKFGGTGATVSNFMPQVVGGGFMEIRLHGNLAFQIELLYSVKGMDGTINYVNLYSQQNAAAIVTVNQKPTAGQFNVVGTQSLKYLDVPVLIKYYLPVYLPAGMDICIYGGPVESILLSAKGDGKVNGQTATVDNAQAFASFDLAGTVGATVRVPLFGVKCLVDARYAIGTFSVDKDAALKIYNRDLTVMAGVEF